MCQTKPNIIFRINALLFYRGFCTLFHFFVQVGYNKAKALVPLTCIWCLSVIVGFVWRQLELAFFGAATSIVALFIIAQKIKLRSESMAVRICPSCGGKVSSTRTTCSHCGHEMLATKICPECEESIDANVQECPICGYEFAAQPMAKVPEVESTPQTEPVADNLTSQEEFASDKFVCNFRSDITKEQFLRNVFYELTKHEKAPADIMKATFGEVQEDETQVFVAMGYGDGRYSATIGYNRIEKYVEQEYGFVSSGKHYTVNGHPRVGEGTNVYHDVEKTRTVTDWQPYNGDIVHEGCHKILTGFLNTKWESTAQSIFYSKKLRESAVLTPETTTLSDAMYSVGIDELQQKIKDKIYYTLPGDQSKDFFCSVSINDYSFARWVLPIYRVYYEYSGQKYCAEGVAIDGIEPILEIPEESATAISEEKLIKKKDTAVKVAENTFGFVIALWVAAFLGASLGIALINLVTTIIGFSLVPISILGAIFLNKSIKKKVKAIEDAFDNRIEKLKHVKGLLFAKKLADYGFDGLTSAEEIGLDLYDVDLEEDIDIDSFLTDSDESTPEGEDNSTVADVRPTIGKSKKTIRTTQTVLSVAALLTLIVGIAFLVFTRFLGIVISNGHGEIYNGGYILHAFSGEILPLFTVVSTIIVSISLLIQLYFDISKSGSFKKKLIINLLAIAFNTVAVVFGFITSSMYWRYVGILLFAILASVCLLFVIIRLILTIANNKIYKSIDETRATGKKALALVLPSILFCLVCGSMIAGAMKEDVTTIDNYAFYYDQKFTSITIPDSVTSIGSYAFSGCTGLTSITIPDSVTSIGYSAFSYCTSLTSVIIGNGVTSIGSSAFMDCTSLISITIPDSITNIESNAFYGAPLEKVTISTTTLSGISSCEETIKEVVISGGQCIGSYEFNGYDSLESIVIPESVTSIDFTAFVYCDNLKSIYYRGTEAQWNAILKENFEWMDISNYTVTYNYTEN